MKKTAPIVFKITTLLLVATMLTGCVYWRLYQTKLQLHEFDRNFSIETTQGFTLNLKNPLIYGDDLLYLGKMQPTQVVQRGEKEIWTSVFRKIDANDQIIKPEINFSWHMTMNQQKLLSAWTLSPLFMEIAPAEFLEASFRAMAGAEVNEAKHQVKANLDAVEKLTTSLPKRSVVESRLGAPFFVQERKGLLLYIYRFILDTPKIEPGYEDRADTKIKLYFNPKTDELVKISGRFSGMKIAIDYRKLVN